VSAYASTPLRERLKTDTIAKWYTDIVTDEKKCRERLAWLIMCRDCEHHTPKGTQGQTAFTSYFCACGAVCFTCDDPSRQSMWQKDRDDVEKTEDEIEELTEYLAQEFGGTFEI
jgi:hypothetical protein